jgi:hypothetical protein
MLWYVCGAMGWSGLSMLRRKRNSLTSGNCMYVEGRDRAYGFLGEKRWSALAGERLDEWQLYVEGRGRCYGTFAGL